MNLRELEQQVVLQEQRALDLTLISQDRLRADEVRSAWVAARALESNLRRHGAETRELMGRLGSVMVDLICADERVRSFPQEATAA
jgi:hypothetical protein